MTNAYVLSSETSNGLEKLGFCDISKQFGDPLLSIFSTKSEFPRVMKKVPITLTNRGPVNLKPIYLCLSMKRSR